MLMGIWNYVRATAAVPDPQPSSNAGRDLVAAFQKLCDELKQRVDPHHLDRITLILTNICKLAGDSALNGSLRGVTGGIEVYKILKEGLYDELPSDNADGSKKPDITIVVEVLQAKVEKMQAKMDEMEANVKKIMIRSKL